MPRLYWGTRKRARRCRLLRRGWWTLSRWYVGASAWALGELATDAARQILRARQEQESDSQVQTEITEALRTG